MKMVCNCSINNYTFKVGRKYVNILNNRKNDKIEARLELTPYVVSRLEEIKEKYPSNSCRRTKEVIDLVCYTEYMEWM